MPNLEDLETWGVESGDLNAIIESPKGSRNKFNYDPERGLFRLGKMLTWASCPPRRARTATRWTCWF